MSLRKIMIVSMVITLMLVFSGCNVSTSSDGEGSDINIDADGISVKTSSDGEEDTELNIDTPNFEGSMDDGEDAADFQKDEDGLTINHQDDTDETSVNISQDGLTIESETEGVRFKLDDDGVKIIRD